MFKATLDEYIIQAPDKRLEERCACLEGFADAEEIVRRMNDVAYQIRKNIYQYPRGFELAAPQIGEPYRIIILQPGDFPAPNESKTLSLINPEILEEADYFYNWEDCLSVQGMRGQVLRCGRIRVRYQDISGIEHENEFSGGIAADIQHGFDHLNGKLFFDRNMRFFIPLGIYRPLKDCGLDVLNDYVATHYRMFDPTQYYSPIEMRRHGLMHPRQCLLLR